MIQAKGSAGLPGTLPKLEIQGGKMRCKTLLVVAAVLLSPMTAMSQPGDRPYYPVDEALRRLDGMIPKNSGGQLGALAPANLNAERPDPPFDLTGTWFVDLSRAFSDFMFGPPYPEFIGQAAEDFAEGQRIRAEGGTYRDAIGQC
ncbi:MAG: hypothetical protein R3305_07755, partial [Gammaproteobacteria bacterium]|nr:hypothetical protein [Gammaproteobacteria bacterium]